MFRYCGFGLRIHSEFELPEFETGPATDETPDVSIRAGTVRRVRNPATLDEVLAVNVVGAAFMIRKGCEITVDVKPGADPASVRAVLLGKVMAFLLRQRGWLPLHASGVIVEGQCVLFLGASGAGKSTMAAALYRAGHLVISDDVGAVRVDVSGRCVVQPAWPHVRLMDDARAVLAGRKLASRVQVDKHRFDLNQTAPVSPCPLAGIYVLEYGETIGLSRYSPSQAIPQLSQHSFVRHHRIDRTSLEMHVRDCANVASLVSVCCLQRPRSLEAISEVARFVENAVKSPPDQPESRHFPARL